MKDEMDHKKIDPTPTHPKMTSDGILPSVRRLVSERMDTYDCFTSLSPIRRKAIITVVSTDALRQLDEAKGERPPQLSLCDMFTIDGIARMKLDAISISPAIFDETMTNTSGALIEEKKFIRSQLRIEERRANENADRVAIEDAEVKVNSNCSYRCKKCGERNAFCQAYQTRSADEPSTLFFTCLSCGNRWRGS